MNLTHLRKLAADAKEFAGKATVVPQTPWEDEQTMTAIKTSSLTNLAEALDRALDALEKAVKQRRSFCQSVATNNDLDYGLQRCLDGGKT